MAISEPITPVTAPRMPTCSQLGSAILVRRFGIEVAKSWPVGREHRHLPVEHRHRARNQRQLRLFRRLGNRLAGRKTVCPVHHQIIAGHDFRSVVRRQPHRDGHDLHMRVEFAAQTRPRSRTLSISTCACLVDHLPLQIGEADRRHRRRSPAGPHPPPPDRRSPGCPAPRRPPPAPWLLSAFAGPARPRPSARCGGHSAGPRPGRAPRPSLPADGDGDEPPVRPFKAEAVNRDQRHRARKIIARKRHHHGEQLVGERAAARARYLVVADRARSSPVARMSTSANPIGILADIVCAGLIGRRLEDFERQLPPRRVSGRDRRNRARHKSRFSPSERGSPSPLSERIIGRHRQIDGFQGRDRRIERQPARCGQDRPPVSTAAGSAYRPPSCRSTRSMT